MIIYGRRESATSREKTLSFQAGAASAARCSRLEIRGLFLWPGTAYETTSQERPERRKHAANKTTRADRIRDVHRTDKPSLTGLGTSRHRRYLGD